MEEKADAIATGQTDNTQVNKHLKTYFSLKNSEF